MHSDDFQDSQFEELKPFLKDYGIYQSVKFSIFKETKRGLIYHWNTYQSLFTILDVLKWKDCFREKIDKRLSHAADQEEGLRLIITEYESLKSQPYYLEGYNAATFGQDIEILSSRQGKSSTSRYHLPEMLIGAGIAHCLPKLKVKLAALENPMPEQQDENNIISDSDILRVKTITPIHWKRKLPLLVYLFHELMEAKIIQGEHVAANLAAIFIDKDYKEIDNKTLNKYFSDLRNTTKKPHDRGQIDELVMLLKALDQRL